MTSAKDITSTEFPRLKTIPEYVTNPVTGGKVVCHKCNDFIHEDDDVPYHDYQNAREFPRYHFHKQCYNQYEHYYGIDRPID